MVNKDYLTVKMVNNGFIIELNYCASLGDGRSPGLTKVAIDAEEALNILKGILIPPDQDS